MMVQKADNVESVIGTIRKMKDISSYLGDKMEEIHERLGGR